MIPKNIFFFLGNEKMSWCRYMTLYSFRKLNPDWNMEIYVAKSNDFKKTWEDYPEQDFHNYDGEDYFDRVESLGITIKEWNFTDVQGDDWNNHMGPSQKSNFFKWEKLYKDGGIYSDMDILYIKPIDEYYETIKNYNVATCYQDDHFSIGFLASTPNNPFYYDIWKNTFKTWTLKSYQSAGIISMNDLLAEDYFSKYGYPSNVNFLDMAIVLYDKISFYNISMDVVYPWKFYLMDEVWNKKNTSVPDNCLGIHWYAGNPETSQKYNCLLNENNYVEYDNTFSYFANKILEI